MEELQGMPHPPPIHLPQHSRLQHLQMSVVFDSYFVTNDNAPMLLDVRRKDGYAHRTQVHRRYKEASLAQERLVFLQKFEHSELHKEHIPTRT